MFAAVIIACLDMTAPDACMRVTDNYGPYRTMRECHNRLETMTNDLKQMWQRFGSPIHIRYRLCLNNSDSDHT